ncbi:MAG TPA: M50 family metallopeptidase [Actinomycetota bacterium]|nr:M50 family metallopeptidase [Actinomycetota bacterium]
MGEWLGIVVFVVAILVAVLIHEAGHFLTAKAFGIKVEEFFVGFGPRLWSFRRGETEYGVKAFPLGGYVRIAGMNPFQEVPEKDRPRTFPAKPIWQRAIVIFAGPVTHFVMAIVFLAVFLVAVGVPNDNRPTIDAVEARLGGRPSPAAQAGLRVGDEIVAINGAPVGSRERLVTFTRQHVGQPIQVTALRDGRRFTATVTPVLAQVGRQRVGRLGVVLGGVRERENPIAAIGRAVGEVGSVTQAIVVRLDDVFGLSALRGIGQVLIGSRPRTPEDPASVVGGARLAGEAVAAGAWDYLFNLLIVFNIFVGIINLVPLPPLDGGHLAVLAYEKVRRRRPDLRKLVPLTALVAAFMILLVVSLTYIDIVEPLPSPFR